MATITFRQTHGTDRADAAGRTRALLERFATKRSDIVKDIRWAPDGQSARITGKGFKGSFEVSDSDVAVNLELGLLARPFKGRVEDSLRRRLAQEFSG